MNQPARKVTVIGSLNIDYIVSVAHLPKPGQTVSATGLVQRFGGKGANQAVAAARQGAQVSMVGCVGTDDAGKAYCRRLLDEGVNVEAICTSPKALTGTALIAVDRAAENFIVVAPGANGELTSARVREAAELVSDSRIVLLQLEIPLATVTEAVRIANRAGVAVVLNPSPLKKEYPWSEGRLDTLIVNEGEAEAIFKRSPDCLPKDLSAWRRALKQRQVNHLIITRGAQSTLCVTATEYFQVPTLQVRPVDTVGAGDAFAGAYAARRAEGMELKSAVRYANCAGALATLKAGAQESIPSRAATERAVRKGLDRG